MKSKDALVEGSVAPSLLRGAGVALAMVLLLGFALGRNAWAQPGPAPDAEVSLQVRANRTHDWVAGKAPAHADVLVRALRNGSEIGQATVNTGTGEEFFTSLQDPQGQQVDLRQGDEVRVTTGTQSAVVRLVAMAADVDAVANTVTGHVDGVPFPASLHIENWEENDGAWDVQSDGSGHFSLSFGNSKVRAGDNMAIWYKQPDGNWSGIVRSHLGLETDITDEQVWGQTTPGARVDLTLSTAGGVQVVAGVATAWANEEGQFGTRFQTPDGRTLDIGPGDKIEAVAESKTTSLVLPSPYRASFDYQANTVCGQAPPGVVLEVELWGYGTLSKTVPPAGNYCVDFSQHGDPTIETEGRVSYHDVNGHRLAINVRTPSPDLKVGKWGDGAPVSGRTYDWHLGYRNVGNAAAESAGLIDTLPQGFAFVSESTGGAIVVGNHVLWDLGTVAPGAEVTITLKVQVNALADRNAENCAEISTPGWERNTENNRACDQRRVVANEVDLSIKKYAIPGDPVAGEQYVYRIGYCNNRPASAQSVVISDTLAAHTQFVSEWHPQGWSVTPAPAGQVRWTMPELRGYGCGELELTVELDADAPTQEPMRNSVSITSTTHEVNADDNRQEQEVWANTPHVNLHVEKSYRRGSPVAGHDYTFWVTMRNDGNTIAPQIVVTDTLPAGATFLQANRFDWNPANGDNDLASPLPPLGQGPSFVSFALGDLAPWRWIGLELTVHIGDNVAVGSPLTNRIRVTSNRADDWDGDNEASFGFSTQAPGPNLRIEKRLEGEACPGCVFDYDLWFVNDGTEPAADVSVREHLPPSLVVQGVDGWGAYRVEQGVLVWDMGTINPGDERQTRLHVRLKDDVPVGTELVNRIEVLTPSTESRSDDNAAEHRTRVGPDLRVVQSLCPDQRLAPGWDSYYCIEVFNAGAATAHDVVLTDILPDALTYRDDSWGGQVAGNRVTWHLGNLNPGWQGKFQLHIQVAPDTPPDTELTNVLEISGDEDDAIPADNHSELPLPVESPYWLQVQETYNWVGGRARPGENLTVTLAFGIAVKKTINVSADANGYFNAGMCDKQSCVDIQPGDSVTLAKEGVTVANLVVNRIEGQVDDVANEFGGHVYGAVYPAKVTTQLMDFENVKGVKGTTDANGDYRLQFPGIDLRPGHRVEFWYIRPDGHWVGIVRQILRLEVTSMPYNRIDVGAAPNDDVNVRVTSGAGALKLSSQLTASADGQTGLDLDAAQPPVDLAPGDVILASTGATTVTLTVPNLLPRVDEPSDQAHCLAVVPPGSSMWVRLWRADHGESWWRQYTTTNADSTIVDFSTETIGLGDEVALVYLHPEGHAVVAHNLAMIAAVAPKNIGDADVATTLTLAGKGFKGTPEVYLAPHGGAVSIQLQEVTRLTGELLQALVPPGAPGGAYDLYLYNPDGWVGFLDNALLVNEWKLYLPQALHHAGG